VRNVDPRDRPLEQRLAVYLSKKFVSQQVHRRVVEDLARALPIEASRPRDVTSILKDAAQGLLDKGLPTLRSFRVTGPKDDRWVAEFVRGPLPASGTPGVHGPAGERPPSSTSWSSG
jgi:hypothetical protein